MQTFYKSIGLDTLCRLLGKSRQAYYEAQGRKEQAQFNASIIVDLVNKEQATAKRVGVEAFNTAPKPT